MERKLRLEQKWPDTIWIVRHGQSAANVARDTAEANHVPVISVDTRDADVPLSALGVRQATTLGQWFGTMPVEQQPTVVLTSPYVRARQTAALIQGTAGIELEEIVPILDERLREKEFGILDRLTKVGIEARYPEQAALRQLWGKFYHRPPGGESWCDVILRLRSLLGAMTRDCRRERVLIVAHSVIVLCFRYLLERMTEEQILTIDREHDVANCSVTSYTFDPAAGRWGKLKLGIFNYVAPLEAAGAKVTAEPDMKNPIST